MKCNVSWVHEGILLLIVYGQVILIVNPGDIIEHDIITDLPN